jgi:hypothetical protein
MGKFVVDFGFDTYRGYFCDIFEIDFGQGRFGIDFGGGRLGS